MTYLLLLLAISFAVSALGWVYFIYFFSIGYGLSISALSVATLIIFRDSITLPVILLCGVLFIYGIRLALYLFLRERKSASYKKILYQPEHHKETSICDVHNMDCMRTSICWSDEPSYILPLQPNKWY